MMAALKAEFRKLKTIRSTYVIVLVALAMLALFAFFIEGVRGNSSVSNPGKFAADVAGAISATGILIMIAGALIMTHEYRYNTIMYTLTSTKGRMRVLLAKIIVISIFAILFAVVIGVLSPVFSYLGTKVGGLTLVPQNIPVWDLFWRAAFTGWAYGMAGLLIATLVRNQVGTIITILFIPATVESLLGLLLKENSMYLPFSSLGAVMHHMPKLEHGQAALLFSGYLLVGWVVAALLFRRRDAN